MELEYNGVKLELLTLERVERENVYDASKTDLLYVRWTIGATCVYSPGGRYPVGTAVTQLSKSTIAEAYDGTQRLSRTFSRGNPPGGVVVKQEQNVRTPQPIGQTALLTDVELRLLLSQPRKKLLISSFDVNGDPVIWLQCPKNDDYPCDPANGPKPLGPPDVIDATGEGLTFGVYFQIECATLPVPDGSDQLILSHRWQMTHEHDENFYLTRRIDGEVIFHAGLLEFYNITPDLFRSQLFHPIPLGFRRGLPVITLSPDGNVLKYTVTDTDTEITFDPGDTGAAQMSIVEKVQYNTPTMSRIFGERGFGKVVGNE